MSRAFPGRIDLPCPAANGVHARRSADLSFIAAGDLLVGVAGQWPIPRPLWLVPICSPSPEAICREG